MRPVLVLGLLATVAVGCGGPPSPDRPVVVATHSILGDLVANVVGDQAEVEVLMARGTDPHEFQASASELVALEQADLVVANGLGFEAGLADAVRAAGDEGVPVLELGPRLDPIDEDPHWFTDPVRVRRAVGLIAAAVTAEVGGIDPSVVRDAAARYEHELRAADRDAAELLAAVPRDRRVLVTNHEVFAYLAERYGFEVVGTVVPGGSTAGEPSASGLADLVGVVEATGVPAVFADTSASDEVARTLAAETGHGVAVIDLYSESLGPPGSDGSTYLDLLRTDAERIAGALA